MKIQKERENRNELKKMSNMIETEKERKKNQIRKEGERRQGSEKENNKKETNTEKQE